MAATLMTVQIHKPEPVNVILGQAHFIKTVEDLHEALVGAVPGIEFGLASMGWSPKGLSRKRISRHGKRCSANSAISSPSSTIECPAEKDEHHERIHH